jgi:phosphoesterase RecJ-like protein
MMTPSFNLLEECKDAKNIIVTGHIKPDGDCIGSTMALTLYLKKKLPKADVRLFLEKPMPHFMVLPGIDTIDSTYSGNPKDTDVCIVLDTNAGRIGSAEKFFEEAKKTINIDHHISNKEGSAMLNFVDPDASSASELIYRMIDKEDIDTEIARYLYLGITHDTGVFRFSNTSKETMIAASELITYGFDFSDLLEKTYYEKTYEQMLTISKIVAKAERFFGEKVVYGYVDYEEYVKEKMDPADFDGAINELRIIRGCECAIFMYPMNEVTVKVSLRSIGTVDVSAICEKFGGGGHKRAAGFYIKGERLNVLEDILKAIEEQTGWTR